MYNEMFRYNYLAYIEAFLTKYFKNLHFLLKFNKHDPYENIYKFSKVFVENVL